MPHNFTVCLWTKKKPVRGDRQEKKLLGLDCYATPLIFLIYIRRHEKSAPRDMQKKYFFDVTRRVVFVSS